VAIKVLPEELARNPERRMRFEREASAIAALKHPNIVTIYALEEDAGVHFIAMELVSGDVLADLIPEGGLALPTFLELAGQVVEAVGSAHAKGITHRDLKPPNIMLDEDGRVKVLDFGLAKLAEEISDDDATLSMEERTAHGQVIGTVAYMSPEQAEGHKVDHRSDIFSLGIVLYEMATGRHPFRRQDNVSTLSAILSADPPPVAEVSDSPPPKLGDIISRCLRRSPDERYQSAAELGKDLAECQSRVSGIQGAAPRPAGVGDLIRRPWFAIPAALLVLGVILVAIWFGHRASRQRWARQQALPEIERILDESTGYGDLSRWQAFQLGREAERFIPDDPVLQQLWRRYATGVTIDTDPPGARVLARPYAAADGELELLGTTPLRDVPFADGVLRVRIEMDGYEPIDDLYWGRIFVSEGRGYVLQRTGDVPEGMVWAPAEAPQLRSGASPAGIHMPGVEHLPPQNTGDFFIDRYEVTNEEFQRFVDAGGYSSPEFWLEPFIDDDGRELSFNEAIARFTDSTGRRGPATWEVGDFRPGTGDHPVTGISWFEAAAYAAFDGKSLPTIYHWERVAITWASGDIVPVANLDGDELLPVGSTRAMHRYGAYDLAGNAREWCANRSSRGGHLILGGGWDDPVYAFNDVYAQSAWDRSPTNGVRCIRQVGGGADVNELAHVIELPFRDFLHETPVSDETFALYLNQFRYDPTPLNAEVEERLVEDDYLREKITFDAAYGGERMMAYLFLPKEGNPPYQTVIHFPGSGAIHRRSSEDLRLGSSLWVPKSGRALMIPVYKSTYERGDDLTSDYPDETAKWRDHVIMWGKDLRRSVDYLETRDDIDHDRLAFQGVSWGAAMAPIMIALEPRIKAGIVVVAGLTFQPAMPEVDQVNYITRVTVPVLMLNGKYDFFFPYETSQLPYYELLGTPPELKKLVVDESSHSFPQTDRARESLAWLDQHFGLVH
jgi:formylglycine-generating enzyme required for sulfatase activity/dienelactone hydrolase